jgi:hypothetical protein
LSTAADAAFECNMRVTETSYVALVRYAAYAACAYVKQLIYNCTVAKLQTKLHGVARAAISLKKTVSMQLSFCYCQCHTAFFY